MDFLIYNPARAWLYRRRHPIWFRYIEPIVSIIAVGVMLVGLFVLEAVAALLIIGGVGLFVLKMFV
jgi:hypothetical protein